MAEQMVDLLQVDLLVSGASLCLSAKRPTASDEVKSDERLF